MTRNRDVLLRHGQDACEEWDGPRNEAGYGICAKTHGERLAHRASYAAVHGPIQPDMHVHHKCENKACRKVSHLELLTPVEHRTLHGQADSTLTWDDVRAIRDANRAGVGIYVLAERYSLSIGTLHPLILNRTWIDPDYTPGVEKACEECDGQFVATKVTKRFCSKKCRNKWNSRRTNRRARGKNPDGSDTRSYRRAA